MNIVYKRELIGIEILIGLLIPFAGTVAGAAMVFLMKNRINDWVRCILTGSAAGVMTAASVWSLLLPSLELSGSGFMKAVPASSGFLAGFAVLLCLDKLVGRIITKRSGATVSQQTFMTALAVTLHNIPEGMAVGVAFAAASGGSADMTFPCAAALAIGIGIQNFPEGAIVSMPLKSDGKPRLRAFAAGSLSGIVEPVAGGITVLIAGIVSVIMPYLLSFAAGAMIYVVAAELIPQGAGEKHPDVAVAGFAFGFTLMMILDTVMS